MVPHHKRVSEANRMLPVGKIAAICVDVGNEVWYLQEIAKYPGLQVVDHMLGSAEGVYIIKVKKVDATTN